MAVTPPTPLSGGTPAKLTIFMNNGVFGWSESWYMYHANQPNSSPRNFENAAQVMITTLQKYLSQSVAQVGARIELIGGANTGWSEPYGIPDLNLGVGKNSTSGSNANAIVWARWWYRYTDATYKLRAVRSVGGWNVDDIGVFTTTYSSTTSVPQNVRALSTDLTTTVGAGYSGAWGSGGTVNFVFNAYDRANFNATVVPVTGFSVWNGSYLQLQLANLPIGFSAGQKIKIHALRQRCVRGVSGQTNIINAIAGPPAQLQTNKTFSCNAAELVKATGTVGLVQEAFFPFQNLGGATQISQPNQIVFRPFKVSVHKTGKPFGGTAGRLSSR